jgi:hypothetical protein
MIWWIRWAPFAAVFAVQRWLWWLVLKVVLPDCSSLIDPKIRAAEGGNAITAKKYLDEIYRFLGILDTKASALMRYNGIILAVIALMASTTGRKLPETTFLVVALTIGSIFACLLVVGVYWRFFEWVNPDGADEAARFKVELDLIHRVLVLREFAYQVAWWLSAVVLIILALHLSDFIRSIQTSIPTIQTNTPTSE